MKKISDSALPDLLTCFDGLKVVNLEQWEKKRRSEILEMFESEMYGRSPLPPEDLDYRVFDLESSALGGKATRKQITIFFNHQKDGPKMDVLIYYPNHIKESVPVFLGLNFEGNHAIHSDPGIKLSANWVWPGAKGAVNSYPTEESRGGTSGRWPIEMILDRGYAVATFYAGDIDPDFDDNFKNGILALYPEFQKRDDNFATIAAWAWGLSRVMDYLEEDSKIDPEKVALMGFSRMGKAALWAGARDKRFAMVISNESGGGGAALSRRKVGEDIARLNEGNPHWFCKNFRKYNNNEEALPFDQHMLLALIAPRPLYVASAEKDTNSDPYGEFLATRDAGPVYELYGKKTFSARDLPEINRPVMGTIGYHIRSGKHDITSYDWKQFLNFADLNFNFQENHK